MKKIVLLVVLGFSFACGSSKTAMTNVNLEAARSVYPDITADQLSEGQQLYENKCTMCHAKKSFDVLDTDGWKNIIPPMVDNVKQKGYTLTAQQVENLTRYIITQSS